MFRYIFEEVDLDIFRLRCKALLWTGLENVGILTVSNNPESFILTSQPCQREPPTLTPATYTFPFSLSTFPIALTLEISNALSCLSNVWIPINMWGERSAVCSVCLRPIVCFHFDPVSFGTGSRGKIEASQEIINGCFQAVLWNVCLSSNYLPQLLHSPEGVYCSQIGGKINLCNSLWNFQLPPTTRTPTAGLGFQLQVWRFTLFIPFIEAYFWWWGVVRA